MIMESPSIHTSCRGIHLQNHMLPAAYHGLPLADIVEDPGLEAHLSARLPTINAALAAPGTPSIKSVVASLLKENAALAAGAPGGAASALGAGSAAVDNDGLATTLAPFKTLEANMTGYNLLTDTGRRDALAAALAPGNLVIVARVVFRPYQASKPDYGTDKMASRNPTLSAFNGLRPHLHEYFNWYMRVDLATGVIDPNLVKYEFASISNRRMLDELTALALDGIDLVKAPGGFLGFKHRRDCTPTPLHIDPRGYYCSVDTVNELSPFASKLLRCPPWQPAASWRAAALCRPARG